MVPLEETGQRKGPAGRDKRRVLDQFVDRQPCVQKLTVLVGDRCSDPFDIVVADVGQWIHGPPVGAVVPGVP